MSSTLGVRVACLQSFGLQQHFCFFGMGGNLVKGGPVGVKWGPLPAVEFVTGRLRSAQIFDIACQHAYYKYEVKMQPEVAKGAVWILPVVCYVNSGRQVFLEPIHYIYN